MVEERFLVSGAKRNSAEFSMDDLAHCYHAVLCEVDFAKGRVIRSYVEKDVKEDIYTSEYTLSFRGCTIRDGVVYTCTHSEIIEIDLESFDIRQRISLPVFNDLHYVTWLKGKLWFAITGLDRVGTMDGGEARLYPVIGDDRLKKIEPGVDYRTLSTKPHQAHPNCVFDIDGRIWVTRFEQKDAVCLDDLQRRMDIRVERPHDGLVVDDRIYFTTVNGAIVVFDRKSAKRLEVHDLQAFYRNPKIGWCRGIEVVGQHAYVAFTRLRKTRVVENIDFITDRWMRLLDNIRDVPPARIIKYDLRKRKIVKEMVFNNSDMCVLFSVVSSGMAG